MLSESTSLSERQGDGGGRVSPGELFPLARGSMTGSVSELRPSHGVELLSGVVVATEEEFSALLLVDCVAEWGSEGIELGSTSAGLTSLIVICFSWLVKSDGWRPFKVGILEIDFASFGVVSSGFETGFDTGWPFVDRGIRPTLRFGLPLREFNRDAERDAVREFELNTQSQFS